MKDHSPTSGPALLRSHSLLPLSEPPSIQWPASTELLVLLVSFTKILTMFSPLVHAVVLQLGLLLVRLEESSSPTPTSWDSNGTPTEAAQCS